MIPGMGRMNPRMMKKLQKQIEKATEEIDAKYLNLVFSGNKDEFNIHRKNKIFSNEIWTTFPNCFKEYYNHFWAEASFL